MTCREPSQIRAVRSWITPKATKGAPSSIEGRGVEAVAPIAAGEVVAVKGGHILGRTVAGSPPSAIGNSLFQIAEDLYLGAISGEECEGVMMLVNHSCQPNLCMGGNIALVSMQDISVGEELTIDYAMFLGDPDFAMQCRCGTVSCRQTIKGTDWMRPDLQDLYRGRFAWWLQQRIDQRDRRNVASPDAGSSLNSNTPGPS
jgi:hypothetical protein